MHGGLGTLLSSVSSCRVCPGSRQAAGREKTATSEEPGIRKWAEGRRAGARLVESEQEGSGNGEFLFSSNKG